MSTSSLFSRSLGLLPQSQFRREETLKAIENLEANPSITFNGYLDLKTIHAEEHDVNPDQHDDLFGDDEQDTSEHLPSRKRYIKAHYAGVNSIAIDHIENRHLISGGADGVISLWDLESGISSDDGQQHVPVGHAKRGPSARAYGVTHLSFYPFDTGAFLSSSYDHHLKVYSTETLAASGEFDLSSVVYWHAMSPIATQPLVACATQHPAVRLVDLNSGTSTHALAGHKGAVLNVAWSPRRENILASAGSDGTVRLWDIRQSAGNLAILDYQDAIGLQGPALLNSSALNSPAVKSHIGPCNGIAWTQSGDHLVSVGHDEQIRVWDMTTGANTLVHFGVLIRNRQLAALCPLILPSSSTGIARQTLVYPSARELLIFELLDGTLIKRMRVPGITLPQLHASKRNAEARAMSLAWRDGEAELYSAHTDGTIRCWTPRTEIDEEVEAELEEAADEEATERKRKRQELDDIFRSMTKQKLTFS